MDQTLLLILNEQISITDALIYALIGFVFVFIGIGLLIGILYLIGRAIHGAEGGFSFGKKGKKEPPAEERPASPRPEAAPAVPPAKDEELSPELRAAIVAAIAAYYGSERPQCEFVIRKIKKS